MAERGGSDWALLRMVRSLPRDRFDCHVAMPGPSPLSAAFALAGATLHTVPMRRITTGGGVGWWVRYALGWPVAVLRLVRLVRSTGADVVHTNSLHSWYGWAAARLTNRPHVWHAREITVQSDAALALERHLCRHHADVVVAMSDAIAAQLDASNVRVVLDDAEPGVFAPANAGRFRARVGIPDTAPLVAGAGRIDTWKGFDVLLDAFGRVKAVRPDAHLVVAGPDVEGKHAYADSLRARAAAMPDVHWVGPRADMADFYADADLFVLASTEPEPFGLVVVEALASGTRCVVTDHGGAPEILDRCPAGGTKVPPQDAAALAEAITSLLPARTSSAARAGRPPLWTPVVAHFDDLYEELLRRAS